MTALNPQSILDTIEKSGGLIVDDLPDSDYFAAAGVSNSDLKNFSRSPAYYQYKKANPTESTPAMKTGTLAHTLILEPTKFEDRYKTYEPFAKRSKADKEKWAQLVVNAGSRELITTEQHEEARRMADAVTAHPTASALLTGGKAERSCWWKHPETGLLCRNRADYHRPGMLVDLKTTADASPAAFGKSVANFRYNVQQPFYTDGFNALGEQIEHFAFVVVEKEAPFGVAVYILDEPAVDLGRLVYERDLRGFARCMSEEKWPGYSDKAEVLKLPGWADFMHGEIGND